MSRDALLDIVLDKKELRGIDRDFAMGVLAAYLDAHPEVEQIFSEDPARFAKKKQCSDMKREVRAQLRHVYGVFLKPVSEEKKDRLLKALIEDPNAENAQALLGLHRSSSERLPYYDHVYREIFAITGVPESILDLGCGLNPYSYPYLVARPAYHCADIAQKELTRIEEFFAAQNIEHSVHCLDLTDVETVKKLPAVDVAFAFKLFDTLEDVQRNITKELLENIPAKWLVASFPTLSIGQRTPMRPRQWFEQLVTGKVAGTVTLPNEYFTIITLEQED